MQMALFFLFFFFFLLFQEATIPGEVVPTVSDELSHWYVFWMKQNPLPKVLCHEVLLRFGHHCPWWGGSSPALLGVRDPHSLVLARPLTLKCPPSQAVPTLAGLHKVQAQIHSFLMVNSPEVGTFRHWVTRIHILK